MTGRLSGEALENSSLPAVYYHAQQVYQEMFNRAGMAGEDQLVYEGHLTKLFLDLHFSTPYYAKVTHALRAMGCIRQLRRGGGSAESQWELLREPTQYLWEQSRSKKTAPGTKTEQRFEQLEQQLRAHNDRLNRLEGANNG